MHFGTRSNGVPTRHCLNPSCFLRCKIWKIQVIKMFYNLSNTAFFCRAHWLEAAPALSGGQQHTLVLRRAFPARCPSVAQMSLAPLLIWVP